MSDKTPLTACSCGSTRFNVMESYAYDFDLDNDGHPIQDGQLNGGVDSITCSECGKEYSDDDFVAVDFQ